MKTIKQLLLLTCMVTGILTTCAQSTLTIEASQLFSTFRFRDKEGVQHNSEYQGILTGAYSIGYRHITEGGFIIQSGIGTRTGGANLVFNDRNYSWKLQYADIKLGLGYMFRIHRVNPFIIASGYYAPLLRGIQTLSNNDFNIIKSDIFKKSDAGLVFTPGVDIKLSEYVSGYLEFNYLMGLSNIEPDSGQSTKNSAHGLTIGFTYLFTK